jgi:hypothetical protein
MNYHWLHVRYTIQRTVTDIQACSYILVEKISYMLLSKQENRGDGRARERYRKEGLCPPGRMAWEMFRFVSIVKPT